MPEITHKDQPSIPGPTATAAKPVTSGAAKADAAVAAIAAAMTPEELEAAIEKVLLRQRDVRKAAMQPKEPNWAAMTEQDAYRPDVYIPLIDHDVPDYMNIQLADPEYAVVWASRDQRRLGQLEAEGYEHLRREHIHPHFKTPLKFAADGDYIYQDVIALRVHKKILYGKRRRALDLSKDQLKRRGADARIKARLQEAIEGDPALQAAFEASRFGFYDTDVA